MHRSKLAGFIIDCKTDNLDAAADFWSAALGLPKKPSQDPAENKYVHLDSGPRGLHIEVQQVSHPSRVHLDIEADDIEAEVARLEALGAKRLEKVRTWVVMEAPTGQRFCVVRPQGPAFEDEAHRWD
jgi:predicted enzyme related to lactoylglutathione lyase